MAQKNKAEREAVIAAVLTEHNQYKDHDVWPGSPGNSQFCEGVRKGIRFALKTYGIDISESWDRDTQKINIKELRRHPLED